MQQSFHVERPGADFPAFELAYREHLRLGEFRALPQTCSYFEPLNECLEKATSRLVDKLVPWSFARHPNLDAPYFEEFRPLLDRDGGVPGFPAELVFGSYLADRFAHLPQMQAYFSQLVDFAYNREKMPVFGCVRTSLRVDWFRHHMPGVHMFISRDPRQQYLSYFRQAVNGNFYFIERPWVIVGNNRTNPIFTPLRRMIDIPDYDAPPVTRNLQYAWCARRAKAPALYQIFYYLHLLTMRNINRDCDLIIDVDRISSSPDHAREVEARISDLTGMAISFADCKVETYDAQLVWARPFFEAMEAEVRNWLRETNIGESR